MSREGEPTTGDFAPGSLKSRGTSRTDLSLAASAEVAADAKADMVVVVAVAAVAAWQRRRFWIDVNFEVKAADEAAILSPSGYWNACSCLRAFVSGGVARRQSDIDTGRGFKGLGRYYVIWTRVGNWKMGMEVAGSDLEEVNVESMVKENNSKLQDKENGKVILGQGISEPIELGSHGVDEPTNGEAHNVSSADFPKFVADEWPAAQQIHHFYLVKYRPYDDPKLKAKIDEAERELQRKNQQKNQINEAVKAKLSDKALVNEQLRPLHDERKQYNIVMDEKRNEMKPLQEALGSLRGSNNVGREKGVGICSSEEELNELIQSIHYRMQHESISLAEEKQLIKEIKQLEGTRENVKANATMRSKIQDSLGQKEVIQEQVKVISSDLDGVRKERETVRSKISYLEGERKAIEKDIDVLKEELKNVILKREQAYETVKQLRKQREEGNACFYQNHSLLNSAKELAAKKEIKALEELSNAEVDKFMSLWSSSKAFRDDYQKRILLSLDIRQFSQDGRMRNPDEETLVKAEPTMPNEKETALKPNPKPPKEDHPRPNNVNRDNIPEQKVLQDLKKKPGVSKTDSEQLREEEDEIFVVEKSKEISKDKEIDPAKLKEMKREEEKEKQRQALERKKKLAEKAAVKAAVRAQKEAEKKLKELIAEREKKLKKKEAAAITFPSNEEDEPIETEGEATEPEKSEAAGEILIPAKLKDQKETPIRSRVEQRCGIHFQRSLSSRSH
ncbi:hypothetical protein Nepgr_026794 [Nepenthes gracilis]|uniref:Proton pump-interactor 1 n=1 Tax=Nepenthes gracilis TaxID=150966 RepID=A0AAD3TAE0_NEPGR|nr:hypothetical protein Nepgr_026794 [Nepenthes gracilis]